MKERNHIPLDSAKVLSLAQSSFAMMVERMINTRLQMNPEVASDLSKLEGKTIGLEITTLSLQIFFVPDTEQMPAQIKVHASTQTEPTTWIRGSVMNLVKVIQASHSANIRLEISGDIGVGETFQRILREAAIDWEELFAQFFGDIPAHQVGNGVRAVNHWAQGAVDSVAFSAGEYLREEINVVVNVQQIRQFINQVDHLRDDVARLKAHADQFLQLREK